MKKTICSTLIITFIAVASASTASATGFWKDGKINRILVDDRYFSGCMISLDSAVGNNCPSSWVSLDCKGLFNGKSVEAGKQKLSTAVAAAHNNNTVSLYINDTHKVNGYCVARRIDTSF